MFIYVFVLEFLLVKGFVLRKDRVRKVEKIRDLIDYRIKRIVVFNYYDCIDFFLIKICFRRKKVNTLVL